MKPATFTLLLLLVLPASAGEPGEVVTTWPDGTVRSRYRVDAEGAKDGAHLEFYADGKRKLRCAWRKGKLTGPWESWHENGKRHVTARYRAGKRHGKYTEKAPNGDLLVEAAYREGDLHGERRFLEGKNVVSLQRWDAGRLVLLDGIEPFPRTEAEIRAALGAIRKPSKPGVDAETLDREAGLRALKEFRYLAGVPWKNLVLDDELCRGAAAGADLCRRAGRLSHTPENPGMPESEYQLGLLGTSKCNLSMAGTSPASVHSYMEDGDASNIVHIGHRAWCLNPVMGRVGFGRAEGGYCAMWAMDDTGRSEWEFDLLCWPPPGYVPVTHFGDRHPFCLWPSTFGERIDAGKVKAAIFALDGDYRRAAKPLPLDDHHVNRGPRGAGDVLIFRAKDLVVEPGRKYVVTVSGLDPKKPFWYLVEFVK